MDSICQRLSRINLNLLIVLKVLLQEKHVTKASEKLHVTQSTVSASLTQLREIFQDELLIRQGNNMVLTAKAQSLVSKVHISLNQLEDLFLKNLEFKPQIAEMTFNLAMDDRLECLLIPELNAYLSENAAGIKITVQHASNLTTQLFIEPNKIDLGLGVLYEATPFLQSEQIFTEHLVCVGNSKNPLLQKPLTLDKYLKAEHLSLFNPQEQHYDLTDIALKALGKTRNITLNVTHISTALYLLMSSSLLATAPFTLIKKTKPLINLSYQELPFPIPDIPIFQVWPTQYEQDSAHQWLRDLIKNLLQTCR